FKHDEPWNSPHNLELLGRMPKIFAPVRKVSKAAHGTFFQVFTGPGAAFEGNTGLRLERDFPDGLKETILVVEAAEAVPSTKPADLAYHAKKPLPAVGTVSSERTIALFGDLSVRSLGSKLSDAELRSLITRNGGEKIDVEKLP